ncbi:hypothetical protein CMQ_853 [Grosmannia clavigera kw1407]|uniref:G-protein coupled receptors family 2 profile 2 domain-containing protein n=1 Tax=Grosmannia clavigera (strain kw1407 / UAMH 11150) TaxID=655863 RepID=F0XF11_GROCL|nr:uncharacterized protein CMQ_853 [Grosmannia clavigera kw1407]EFX03925.1 hypothetical protein CMQ_853 [Grosmannia clavigera kw1407]
MDHTFALAERAACISPFLLASDFESTTGCVSCCLPCPFTDWVYPENFNQLTAAAEWIAVISTICCVALLLSWAMLPVEKTHRHYLSICLTTGVLLLSLGFVIPLAGHPEQCADPITPNSIQSSSICGASGLILILGGWSSVVWVFLRSMSLHLQICWQVVVGRSFMWFALAAGWGIPILGTILAAVLSGVSFRLGATCHINHKNSLGDLWIPLLVFAGLAIIIQLFTFAYCIKVYLASLSDNAASTEGSGLPSYTNSIRTMTPRQAYRRVRRVIQLQWRGIAIVLIICVDVIFFSVVFVFQDNTVVRLAHKPSIAVDWLVCLVENEGKKDPCLYLAGSLTVKKSTVGAVLILLAMNGLWLVVLLGRWSIVTGWAELFRPAAYQNKQREFVSVDARLDDLKKDTHSPTPLVGMGALASLGEEGSSAATASARVERSTSITGGSSGRRTPDYFNRAARYNAPSRSSSNSRPLNTSLSSIRWDAQETFAPSRTARSPPPRTHTTRSPSQDASQAELDNRHPLGMNRI